jgi:hypothetical protein
MATLFIICAIIGGTLLVCQFLLSLVGVGGHHDMDHDVGGDGDVGHDAGGDHHADHHQEAGHEQQASWYVGVLSFRALLAALTFFGLGGLAATGNGDTHPMVALAVALAAGAAALFLVAFIMRSLHKLKADGTLRFDRAIGSTGTVYLTIPGKRTGTGKVTLVMQNRTVECQAVTADNELPTGSKVVVVSVVAPGTVEVAPA